MGGVLVAHQPAYLPWPGYFSRLADADELVLLDHVQFSERGWQNRNYIRGTAGLVRLTVPVRRRFGQSIADTRIADASWAGRHWRSLVQTYGRAPYWPEHQEALEAVYQKPWTHLAHVTEALLRLLLDAFDLPVAMVRTSDRPPAGQQTDMLINLCRQRGATRLRVGTGALGYLNLRLLAERAITVEVASYSHPPYGSAPGWRPGLSSLDLLLHEGPNALAVLRAGARTETKVSA
ncbi:WbqC family protein [Streptomyces sp. C10-9-1]|uniref:WbqC family protein n=1 Tax=Streptomyces sp. C10-9-1 TaxID=1859285 RepID=UPI0021111704|nr:WbqC family protein [Streptomyces sp. C10-9-1]MCQ6556863.1 WbqC family protein [Streptomyces sp. C10-9-1]